MPQRAIIGEEQQSLAADGQTTKVYFSGGRGTMTVFGTFGGGTVKLQRSVDNGTTWIDVSGASVTANGQTNFEFSACYLRADLSGATTPSVTVEIAGYVE